VRRFGTVLYPPDKPLEPGLHFKLPFIDTADKLQVSLQTTHVPTFEVLTVDNQKVAIEENFNFTIPKEKVYHVLYEVGRPGNVDIANQVVPVALDRAARVFAAQNMVTVNAKREDIQAQVEKNVSTSVEELFGIKPHSLQIARIKPSDAFMESIDKATMAKNEAIAAENQLRTKQFEAQQAAATAKGQADAAIEKARGEAESIRLKAEAEKTQLVLTGEGQKSNLESQIKPFGNADTYINYLKAKAQLNWNGVQPQIMTGNGTATNLVVPLQPMTAPGEQTTKQTAK
ncbi:MAG TPA: SPFH domain-containing protein, partial [Saprospiraceae bacterium]|nr:SPFH domain-containing protein [Saprospiraceae bacterium]